MSLEIWHQISLNYESWIKCTKARPVPLGWINSSSDQQNDTLAHLQQLRYTRQQYYEKSVTKTSDDKSVENALKDYLDRYHQASRIVEEKALEAQRILEHVRIDHYEVADVEKSRGNDFV